MKLHVHHQYGDHVEHFEGEPEQVRAQLHNRFPWLKELPSPTLQDDISRVGAVQAYKVEVEP